MSISGYSCYSKSTWLLPGLDPARSEIARCEWMQKLLIWDRNQVYQSVIVIRSTLLQKTRQSYARDETINA